MKLVVKIGGQAQEDPVVRRQVAAQIAELAAQGHRVTVVHGGGKILTQTLDRLGLPTEFHNGLRVTDAATRDVALMVLAGIVNKRWVAELDTVGQPALGLCGGDAGLVKVRRHKARAGGKSKDLGFVGRPERINTAILETAFRGGLIPVVASVALGPGGEYFNINADDLAAALASALKADRLFYLTESGGVWDAEKRLMPLVKVSEISSLIHSGVVKNGMIPKLRSCARTVASGVREIDILSPDTKQGLVRALEPGQAAGTRIVNK